MSIRPVTIVTGIVGLAVKWVILLAAGLFIYDMIQLKKEENHGRNNGT